MRLRSGVRSAVALVLTVVVVAAVAPHWSQAAEKPAPGWVVPGVRIEPLDADSAAELDVAAVGSYRGSIELQPGAGGLTVVNHVSMDDYVRGIAEVPSTWPPAALQAQAIATRTYALSQLAAGKPLCATDACQVYAGLTKERADTGGWAAAVAGTAGQVLLWKGAPILAMYSSSNGGQMVAGSQPYLRAGPDPDDTISPDHAWESSISFDALQSVFSVPGPVVDVGRTAHDTVAITYRTDGGRPAADSSSSSTTSSTSPPTPTPAGQERAQGILDPTTTTTTTSDPISPSTTSTTAAPDTSTTQPTLEPSPSSTSTSTSSTTAPSLDGTTTTTSTAAPPSTAQQEVSTASFVQRLNATQPPPDGMPQFFPSSRFEVHVDPVDAVVAFVGHGFGHGIGMSQFGAFAKARRGLKAADILAFYYAGIRPSLAPAGMIPPSIPVVLDTGRAAATVSAPGRFRVVSDDGVVLAVAAWGAWQFSPAGDGQVRVVPPPDQQGGLTLAAIGADVDGAAAGTVDVRVSLSLPAIVRATVAAPAAQGVPRLMGVSGTPAAEPTPAAGPTPVPTPAAGPAPVPAPAAEPNPAAAPASAPAGPSGPGDTVLRFSFAAPPPGAPLVVHLDADAGGGRVASADVPLDGVLTSAVDRAPGGLAAAGGPAHRAVGASTGGDGHGWLVSALAVLLLVATGATVARRALASAGST